MERSLFLSHRAVWKMEKSFFDKGVESPIFSLYRIQWQLKLQMTPERNYHREYFEMHLAIADAPINYASVNFCISWKWKHHSDRISQENETHVIVSELVSGRKIKICENSIYNLNNNFCESFKNRSEDFSINNLVFVCSIKPDVKDCVSLGLQEEQFPMLSLPCTDSLAKDFQKALLNPEYTDIILRCGDKIIQAHKAILSSRSEVFQAMFRNDLKESQEGVVNITDVEASIFEQFISYIYTGNCNAKTVESMCSIYEAADKYNIEALRERCVRFIRENLETHQACKVLIMADMHHENDLKMYVMEYIINRKEFLLSEEWLEFAKDYPYLAQDVFLLFVQKAEIY